MSITADCSSFRSSRLTLVDPDSERTLTKTPNSAVIAAMADLAAAAVIDENLREAMRFFGQATGQGGIHDYDGVRVIDSGIDYAVFNISLFTAPAVATRADFDERIGRPEIFFRNKSMRWSHWTCLDLLPPAIRSHADEVFRGRGLRKLTEAPGMLADRLLAPTRPLPVLRWRPVSDSETRIAFAHITSMSFDIPFMTCRSVYETECAWEGSYRGYVGYFQNTPVCTAAIVVAAGAIGIYSVATLPGYRRRGFAESLLRNVLAQVSAETKFTRCVLQSTKAGYDLYRRMGFDIVGRFAVYLT